MCLLPPSSGPDEAASKSETSVNFYQTTRRYNPEDSQLQDDNFKNLGYRPIILNILTI
jgi:hypothetical protein